MNLDSISFEDAVTSRGSGAKGLPKSEWISDGKYPVIGQGSQFIEGWTNRKDLLITPNPSLVLYGGHTRRTKYVDFPFVLGPNVKVLEAKSPLILNHHYLFYFLFGLQIKSRGYADHFTEVKRASIPLHTFDDQIRIVYLLGKVQTLIDQRKQHLQQLNELLKSVFLEMFGDPLRNEMKWDKKVFDDLLVNIDSGKSPKCEARSASEDEWGVLKLGAVTKCTYNELENKALPKNVAPSINSEVKVGDLLFSRKNTYELVAACAYVFATRPKLLMPDLIFRFVFRDDSGINPIYIWKLLTAESQRKSIQSMAGGAAGSMPNISKANLRKVLLPIPPLPLQDRFAVIVKKVEGIKSYYQKSLTDLESLYATLSQQAFNGELDLSRIKPPTQRITVPATEDPSFVSAATTIEQLPTINLPNPNCPAEELYAKDGLRKLIIEWVETYRTQLANEAFSIERFMTAVQNRLMELYPDNEFEMDANKYEYIKEWVFLELEAGRLEQSRNVNSNMIELRAVQS